MMHTNLVGSAYPGAEGAISPYVTAPTGRLQHIFFAAEGCENYNIYRRAGIMAKDIDYWVKYVEHLLEESEGLRAEGAIELGDILQESAFDDVPTQIVEEVKKKLKNA